MKYEIIAVVVVVAIVLGMRLRGGKQAESRPPRSLLRQFGDLCPQDLEHFPVWVHCHIIDYDEPWYDDTDEETFRPWDKGLPVDPTETMFLVKAMLTLADGSQMSGFLTPQNPSDSGGKPDLGLIQPHAFLTNGKSVGFWFGILTPAQEEITSFYTALGKSHQDVFPIDFEVKEGLATGITSGSIPGFCSRDESDEIKVTK